MRPPLVWQVVVVVAVFIELTETAGRVFFFFTSILMQILHKSVRFYGPPCCGFDRLDIQN
jgi:hypothetical protein